MPKRMDTTVEESKAAIQGHMRRFSIKPATFTEMDTAVAIEFVWRNRHIRFVMPLPGFDLYLRSPSGRRRVKRLWVSEREYQYDVRRRWRAMARLIRSKLYAVASEARTFDQEFGGDLGELDDPSADDTDLDADDTDLDADAADLDADDSDADGDEL